MTVPEDGVLQSVGWGPYTLAICQFVASRSWTLRFKELTTIGVVFRPQT